MTESKRNAMFDKCFEYDDHLRANGHRVGGEALQGPETALTASWKNGKVATTDGPHAETRTFPTESGASANGGRQGSTYYLLDGVQNMDTYLLLERRSRTQTPPRSFG